MNRIALVHDQLMEFGGAERVLAVLMDMYPDADIYTSFYDPDRIGAHRKIFENRTIRTSWAHKVPLMKRLYSPLRFVTPYIWESLDLSAYDVVISSSGSYMCKGVITKPDTRHICYIHHPPRYLYYYETAIEWQKHWPVRVYGNYINHPLRIWDYLSSQRVDTFVANSLETGARVRKLYRRDARVIYPPVDVPDTFENSGENKGYYLTVSRLARAKHIDVLIQAARAAGVRLKIVGAGRDSERLTPLADGTIEFCGNVSDNQLKELYAGAKAFLFASVDEEFGIAPVEAMGHGLPVIAYASGGLKETVRHTHNGFLSQELTPESFAGLIRQLEKIKPALYTKMRSEARKESLKYTTDIFKKQMKDVVRET